jgi:hypothetical protein
MWTPPPPRTLGEIVHALGVSQEVAQLMLDLNLDNDEQDTYKQRADEIARNWQEHKDKHPPDFLAEDTPLFDPITVATNSLYVQQGTTVRTDFICRNAILSLLRDNVEQILIFCLSLYKTSKQGVGAGYTVFSILQALLCKPQYDLICQVSMERIDGLNEEDGVPSNASTIQSKTDYSDSDDDMSDESVSRSSSADSWDSWASRASTKSTGSLFDPAAQRLPNASKEVLKTTLFTTEAFILGLQNMAFGDVSRMVKLLIQSIVGFLIPQKGECEHPAFSDQWSVNLICSYTIPGQDVGFKYDLVGSGQALLALFLMSVIDQGGERACLELASGFKNITGLCVYSKLGFVINYRQLLLEPHLGTMFYAPGNLPMSINLVGKTNEDIRKLVMYGAKHDLCSVARTSITLKYSGSKSVKRGNYAIANAQREMTATRFLDYLIDVIIYCTHMTVAVVRAPLWRKNKLYQQLLKDALSVVGGLADEFAGRIKVFYALMDTCVSANGAGLQELKADIMHYDEAIRAHPGVFNMNAHTEAIDNFNTERDKQLAAQNAARAARAAKRGPYVPGLVGISPSATPRSTNSDQVPSWLSASNASNASRSFGWSPAYSAQQDDQSKWVGDEVLSNVSNVSNASSLTDYLPFLDKTPSATQFGFNKPGFSLAPTAAAQNQQQMQVQGLQGLSQQDMMQKQRNERNERLTRMVKARGFNIDDFDDSSDDDDKGPKRSGENMDRFSKKSALDQPPQPNVGGGKKQTKNKRKGTKPKTKRRANKKNKKAQQQQHAGRVSRHNKVFRRKTRRSK